MSPSRWDRPGTRRALWCGEVEAYGHSGGRDQEDSAAPVAVAVAAGPVAVRLDGSALPDDEPDPPLPDLPVCRPEREETILTALGAG